MRRVKLPAFCFMFLFDFIEKRTELFIYYSAFYSDLKKKNFKIIFDYISLLNFKLIKYNKESMPGY